MLAILRGRTQPRVDQATIIQDILNITTSFSRKNMFQFNPVNKNICKEVVDILPKGLF